MLLTDKGAIGLQHLETGGLLLHLSMVLFTAEKCIVGVLDMSRSLSILYCGDFSKVLSFVVSRFHTRWTAYMIT